MAIALLLVFVAVGSVLFHFLSPWWWTPIASNWSYIDDTIIITFWITGGVFVAIVLFMAYCILGTAVGVAAMLAPGLVVWHQYITVPHDASAVEVVGQQWSWNFRLPGKDGKIGLSDTRLISPENPLGLNRNDPNGLDDIIIEGSDLHLPVGKPVKVLLRAVDVLHDFYVPQFRAKMDMVPGVVTYYWFTPTITGKYEILCAELCGIGHPNMRSTVVVDKESDYQAWLDKQQTFAQLLRQSGTKQAAYSNEAK